MTDILDLPDMKPKPEDRCASCNGLFPKQELQVDHIKPFVRGERSTNLMLICHACNARFHTKPHAPSSAASTR